MLLRAAACTFMMLFGLGSVAGFAQYLPPGSYRQSCTNIQVNGNQLSASCTAPNGGRVTTSTPLSCNGDIGNVNGVLRCNGGRPGGGGPSGAAPNGSYRQSCTNVRVSGGQLTANCSSPSGGRVTSSTSVICSGDIGNVNGYLRCNGSGGGPRGGAPSGSYQQSCTNIRMQGSMLTATCSAPNGQRITSSIDVRYCRFGGDIGNLNGNLNCRRQ